MTQDYNARMSGQEAIVKYAFGKHPDCNRWPPGVSGNPKGRPALGASFIDQLNMLGAEENGRARYPQKALKALAADQGEVPARRLAAAEILGGYKGGEAKNGMPLSHPHKELILDRTVGKPKQQVEVVRHEVADPRALLVQLAAVLGENPALREALGVQLGGLLSSIEDRESEGAAECSGAAGVSQLCAGEEDSGA